jgi:hypothetical protein
MTMACEWFDDPCFDDVQERVGGKLLSGDAWRRYMRVKERLS